MFTFCTCYVYTIKCMMKLFQEKVVFIWTWYRIQDIARESRKGENKYK